MKRLFVLVVLPGMMLSSEVRAEEVILPSIIDFGSTTIENCPQPVQVQCETPVIVVPRLRTVRRSVPRTTYQTVTKTIMVPIQTLETRQTQSVEYREEVRERAVTVYEIGRAHV